jgi:hypothetical protein
VNYLPFQKNDTKELMVILLTKYFLGLVKKIKDQPNTIKIKDEPSTLSPVWSNTSDRNFGSKLPPFIVVNLLCGERLLLLILYIISKVNWEAVNHGCQCL